jgi:hypothetical protein
VQAYLFHNRIGPDDRPNWIIEAQRNGHLIFYGPQDGPPHLMVQTLEGDMRADPGDWIIRGVAGELYPCKPDIFDATYEPVNETLEGEQDDADRFSGVPSENLVGAAEAELGRYIYRRIEALMVAEAGTPEATELSYLAKVAEVVEEWGEDACGADALASLLTPLDIDAFVQRFLGCPVPATECADACAVMPGYKFGRSGTNFLSAAGARQMFEHIFAPWLRPAKSGASERLPAGQETPNSRESK